MAFAGSFCSIPLVTFLPVFARDIFHRDAKGYSGLLAAFGIGAVVGAIGVAGFGHVRRKGLVAVGTQMTFGGLMVGFALSRNPILSYAILFVAGAALMVIFAMFMTLVQTNVEDHLRGRVVSIYSLAFRGAMPISNLLGVGLASVISVPTILVVERRRAVPARERGPPAAPPGRGHVAVEAVSGQPYASPSAASAASSFARRTGTFFPLMRLLRRAATIASASSPGTSTSEKRSAISIAPIERAPIPASPVIAPTRSPGRMPAWRPAETWIRTVPAGPAPGARTAVRRARRVRRGPGPRSLRFAGTRAPRGERGGDLFGLAGVSRRRVGELHGRGGHVDDVELLGERLDDDADVVQASGEELLPQGRARDVEPAGTQVRHRRDGGDLDLLLRERLDGPQQPVLARLGERDGGAGAARAPRAADPVDVRLRRGGTS